jgi:hypothetical protein
VTTHADFLAQLSAYSPAEQQAIRTLWERIVARFGERAPVPCPLHRPSRWTLDVLWITDRYSLWVTLSRGVPKSWRLNDDETGDYVGNSGLSDGVVPDAFLDKLALIVDDNDERDTETP